MCVCFLMGLFVHWIDIYRYIDFSWGCMGFHGVEWVI